MNTNPNQVVVVEKINLGSGSLNFPSDLTEFNDKLYFMSRISGIAGRRLLVSDGTTEGTSIVADIMPDIRNFPGSLIEFNDKLYFSANDGESGKELWVSDGTQEGTNLVADININPVSNNSSYSSSSSSSSYGSSPSRFIEFNDKLYFSANDGENGTELWVSNGTAEGTNLVADINPGINGSSPGISFFKSFIEFNGKLYFPAYDEENGIELWVSDGTAEGTNLFADLSPARYGSSPSVLIEFNDKLYFSANDGENGSELWVSDGTREGTNLFADLNPGRIGSYPSQFIEFNNKLYFSARDQENGSELWVSDGTVEGTNLVADIDPGPYGSNLQGLTEFNGKLYFSANDGENGRELWVSDGTSEGTNIVTDMNPRGFDDYFATYNRELAVVGDQLFFTNAENGGGTVLFKLTISDSVTQTQLLNTIIGKATDGDDEITGSQGNDGIAGESGNDVLDGQTGNDALDGGAGNDTLDGGAGTDTAVYRFAPAGVSVILGEADEAGTANDGFGSTDSLLRVENVIGSDGDDFLTGNSGNNSLTGRDGNDALIGGAGDDLLTGSMGADTLAGGEGSDQFVYLDPTEGGDTITDFAVGTDKIAVVAAGLAVGLLVGELRENRLAIGSAATGSDQRFVFDESSSELFFDADGSGDLPQQLIATLDGVSNISAGDIMLL